MFKRRNQPSRASDSSKDDGDAPKYKATPGYSLLGDGDSASNSPLRQRASIATPKVQEEELTPAQRMAMTRRRYSIMNLDKVKRLTSSWATNAKKKVEEKKSPLVHTVREGASGSKFIICMEDPDIRKDK